MYPGCPAGGNGGMRHDEVGSRLRHLLTEGEIPPGARIPERELCASLSISRTPLREALKVRSEEHTSELQSHLNLVCRLLLEKKKKKIKKALKRSTNLVTCI